jgi:hypothetical protein
VLGLGRANQRQWIGGNRLAFGRVAQDARENRSALVDRPGPDACLDPFGLPRPERRDRELAEWDAIESRSDVNAVDAGARSAEPTPFRPGRHEVIDPLQAVSVGELNQRLSAGSGPFAGKRRERRERELRVDERQSAFDREPARPLGGGAGVRLRLSIE